MANFLREFNNHADYVTFTQNVGEFVTPNVSTCKTENELHYNPKQNTANQA